MSVDIEPTELGFHRPFTLEVSEILKIKNPNSTPVAFKVKTTAPKQYCVRPNSGRIEPGKSVEVTVLLQAMKQEPPLDAKCRDKFLVQSVAVTADKEFSNIAAIWQHVDNAEKSTVQEKKIRVVFLPPSPSTTSLSTPQRNSINGNHGATPETAPPAYSSPTATFTPNSADPISRMSDKPADNKSLSEASSTSGNPPASSFPRATLPDATGSAELVEVLKAQLAEARAQIAEGSLRQRKTAVSGIGNDESGNTGAAVRPAVSEGVSLQITAILCLMSFLIAYFLF